jgi:hypothetical protein
MLHENVNTEMLNVIVSEQRECHLEGDEMSS